MNLQQSPVLGHPCLQQCGLKEPWRNCSPVWPVGPELCLPCAQLQNLPPASPQEPRLCLGLCFYFPSLAFLPTFSSSCLGSSETMSHSCSPLALSGPYPTPRHYVSSLPSPLTITPATISLPWSLCSLSSWGPPPSPF